MTDIVFFMHNGDGRDCYLSCAQDYDRQRISAMAERIYDSHCHVYADRIAPKAVDAINDFYGGLPVSSFDGTVSALLHSGKEHDISGFVVHSVATKPGQVSPINAYFGKLKQDLSADVRLFALGAMHPESEDPGRDFEELLDQGLTGVKMHPDIQKFPADCPEAMGIYEMCEEKGLPVLLHTGDFRYDYSNPDRIARILRRFPKLRLVGAHFGGWSVWEEALRRLSDFENFAVDTSSSLYWLKPGRAKEIIRAWGSGRVMFGTDYPMWDPGPELEYLRRLELEREEYEDICWRTCERIYGNAEP